MTRHARPIRGSLARTSRALALGALALVALPGSAAARCVAPLPIGEAVAEADAVIVGTVTAVAREGTVATVTVAEIWRGPDLPAIVVVRGGPGGDGRTSVDRTFDVGTTYLFILGLDADGQISDSACSSTTTWDPELAAIRPFGAHAPGAALEATAGEAAPVDPWALVAPVGTALLVAAALLGARSLARERQTNR